MQLSRAAQAILLAATIAGGAIGWNIGTAAPQQQTQATRGTAAPTVAGAAPAATIARTSQPGAFDPCALVTTAEAGTVLEKAVTALAGPPPSTQCQYRPQSAAIFEFASISHGSRPARITINSVVITAITGRDAAARFDAKQATFGRDPEDRQVAGLGDKAIVTKDQLSVLQGSSFVNVAPDGGYDFGSGAERARYLPLQQKWDAILQAFARPALQRLGAPAAAATAAATRAAAQTQAVTQPTTAVEERPAATQGSGPIGAILGGPAGLLAFALAKVALARRGPTHEVEQPSLPAHEVFRPDAEPKKDEGPRSAQVTEKALAGVDLDDLAQVTARIDELQRERWGDTTHAGGVLVEKVYPLEDKYGTQEAKDEGLHKALEVLNDAKMKLTIGLEAPELPSNEVFDPEPKKPEGPTM